MFFPGEPEAPGDSIKSPYIVGFNHGRESTENAFSVGPTQNIELEDYQHPEYCGAGCKGFREEFDYYSVGIVFMELGRWRLLCHITKKETLSPVELKGDILADQVPHLGSYMGQIYPNAITTCLDGTLAAGGGGPIVVQPLAKCLVLHPGSIQAHP
jgi:hypothetical protein